MLALLFYCLTLLMLLTAFIRLKCKTFDLFKLMFFLSTTMTFGQKIK